ncbi:RbsD/FucU domain-containing protein [Mycobacteroides salmoniphilum]|uniref:RbsD/FucU domain-containing protein n=1 Tax=Mycobacteroides salmoniphilum TaxID=404941 RepID=UPI0012FF7151|nr:RbsD/FucU domain-containing protein [Mycobacteroides salmoniphilum]
MITGAVAHPQILPELARANNGSVVLVCDVHYATATCVGPNSRAVYLKLRAGTPTVPEVTSALLQTISVEHVTQMQPVLDALPSVVQCEIVRLAAGIPRALVSSERSFMGWQSARMSRCSFVTGDTCGFGNVVSRVGVLST